MVWRQVQVVFCSLCISGWFLPASAKTNHFLQPSLTRNQPLTLSQGQGYIDLAYSHEVSEDFFTNNGARRNSSHNSFAGGSRQRYVEHTWLLSAAYGFTDRITLRVDLPIRYRRESISLVADDFGIGDFTVSMLYSLFAHENGCQLAVLFGGKVPSGDSDIQLLNIGGSNRDLPLGTGQIDLFASLLAAQEVAKFTLSQELGFRLRMSDLVEYLQAIQEDIDPLTNQPFSIPAGNARINFGDEILVAAGISRPFLKRFIVGLHSDFVYFLKGSVQTFDISLTVLEETSRRLTPGFLWTVQPFVTWHWSDMFHARASVTLPIAGESHPQVPIVDSLVGNTYTLALTYDF